MIYCHNWLKEPIKKIFNNKKKGERNEKKSYY